MLLRKLALLFVLTVPFWASTAIAQNADNSPEWKKTVTAAMQEGSLMVYGNLTASVIDRLRADFAKQYPGISVEYARLPGAALFSRIDTDRKTGQDVADVVVSSETAWLEERAAEKWFTVPSGPAAKGWPARFMDHGAVATVSIEPFVILYNSNLVKMPI